ncbi:hypothetical protein ACFXMT_34070 [Streptomyces mirabilis]|uniref:hypothetical protein n=1 Tax=Streptomyces mirabilis TaxID=68239 RepID=UPI0036CD8867
MDGWPGKRAVRRFRSCWPSAPPVGAGTVAERRDDVRNTAAVFETALGEGVYDRMCAVLAPATVQELEQSSGSPCAKALSEESPAPGGPLRRTDVYGNQARTVLSSDTLFLSHFTSSWKVVAAGCEPQPQQLYQCRIKGG